MHGVVLPSMVDKLHKYARKGKHKKLDKALKYIGDVDELDKEGKTALYYAAKAGHKKCVKLLLSYGANAFRYSALNNFYHFPIQGMTNQGERGEKRIIDDPPCHLEWSARHSH